MLLSPPPSLLSITSTVKTRLFSSKLELGCLYSERSQVQSANWKYQNKSRQLYLLSNGPGRITTILPRPITSDTAGNYTCTLQLKHGLTIWATQAVTLPNKGERDGMVSQRLAYFLCKQYIIARESWQTSCQVSGDNKPWMLMNLDMCSVKRSTVHSRQPQVNSSAREPPSAPDRYHMLCFLNVVKEVTGQDFCVSWSCDLQIISSWITQSIYVPMFHKRPPQF